MTVRWKRVVAFTVLCSCFIRGPSGSKSYSQVDQSEALIQGPIDESKTVVLRGNTHPLARARYDQGAAPPDLPMDRMLLVLKRSPQQEAALKKLIDDQQDKASSFYHKWLTPEVVGQRFGPSDADVQAVTSWLQGHGFKIAQVSKGRTIIEFSGTAEQVQSTLHTSIHRFRVNGENHWANANDPQIPAALSPVVGGVLTLHNFLKKPQIKLLPQPWTAQVVAGHKPEFTSGSAHALFPADFQTIYNVKPPVGASSKIGIVGRSNINILDVVDFSNLNFDQAAVPNVVVNGPDPGDLGGAEEAEAVLDTTWAGAVSPYAFLQLVVSASTNTTDGVDLSELYIIDNNISDVMSESFGDCEANFTSAQALGISDLAQQAAVQGITYVVASGDSGSAGCDDPATETQAMYAPSVNILASTPYTVAVGGTIFNEHGQDSTYWSSTNAYETQGSALSYIPENVWNESCPAASCGSTANIYAGGGGASVYFSKPAWQSGVTGIPADGARDLPDVSFTAAGHDPYLICLDGSCSPNAGTISLYGVAGTSASTPAFAGIMSLVVGQTFSRQGQPNYVLYRLAAAENLAQCNGSSITGLPSNVCVFNDVTVGNNAVPGENGYGTSSAPYQSTTGYDLATGLGSINVGNLLSDWNTITFSPTSTTFTISPTSLTHGDPVNVTVKVTSNSNSGVPTGPVWLLPPGANYDLTFDIFTLDGSGSVATVTHKLPGGFYQVLAHYAGDGTYAPSDSAPSSFITVSPEATTTVQSVLTTDATGNLVPFSSGPYGTPVYLQAKVVGTSGYGVPTSYANFYDNGGSSAASNVYLNSNAVALSMVLGQFSIGSHSITAGYNGDLSFANSFTKSAVAFTITKGVTTAAVSSQPTSQGVTLIATINTGGYGTAPTGSVTFYLGGNSIGTGALSAGTAANGSTIGIASLTNPMLSAGQNTITAQYAGDGNYSGSTAPPTVVTLQADFAMAASRSSLILSPGVSAPTTITISGLEGFNGLITFSGSSCSGLPAESSCSFSPASITGSGSTTMTLTTTAPTSSKLRAGTTLLPWWLATWMPMALIALPGSRRKRFGIVALCLVALLMLAPGCGGGGTTSSGGTGGGGAPNPGTPPGSYTVIITATSGSLTHSVTLPLQIQ